MNKIDSQTDRSGLNESQVSEFRERGYLIYDRPVFPQAKFAALKNHFDELLADLPADIRPESMDVPHFIDPKLFQWLFADEVLNLIEPILGPDIALFSSHFICKPQGDGRRVPWHSDAHYWTGMLEPMEVVTLWLAIDPSTENNGCMHVFPESHDGRKRDYVDVDPTTNVFPTEIKQELLNESRAVPCILQPNQASLHDGHLVHGSPPNTSDIRRCGYTMRYIKSSTRFNPELSDAHAVFLARGKDYGINQFADPTKAHPELMDAREHRWKKGH